MLTSFPTEDHSKTSILKMILEAIVKTNSVVACFAYFIYLIFDSRNAIPGKRGIRTLRKTHPPVFGSVFN